MKRKRRFQKYLPRVPKYRQERNLIKGLEQRLREGAPERGTDPGAAPPLKETDRHYVGARMFVQLPLSQPTLRGLEDAAYREMTDIQRSALPHALVGRDVLGAAKTGSGKTLVFLITLLEQLYRQQWTRMDGLGALILSPVRELALQIFEELRKIGKFHDFSAGLLIGGKDVDTEKSRIAAMNILIATPGRLLHHLDETVGFDVSPLQMLVLDEADRLLDMGFAPMLDAILGHLPQQRQSMLFSATQTKSVKDLVRLSLNEPEYLAVHAEAPTATPVQLRQYYVAAQLSEKLTVLWSFLKSHPRAKVIVFVSTCTQVRFLYEAMRKLLSQQHVCCLHGRIKQNKRTETFFQFCQSKAMVLFATDVAARGLDFPEVDWVVQLDCADSVSEYIHRVGRTARYTAEGQALLILMRQEHHILEKLKQKQIPIRHMKLKTSALKNPTAALRALLTKTPKMKECGQKYMVTYLKSYLLNKNNAVEGLDVESFAVSLGMMSLPSSKALKKLQRRIQPTQEPPSNSKSHSELQSENETELFTPAEPSEELSADHQHEGPVAAPLLKELTETWQKDVKEEGFSDAYERYSTLKDTLQQRLPEDRALIKSWRKEAAARAKEAAHLSPQFEDESSELVEISCSEDEEVQSYQKHFPKGIKQEKRQD